MLTPEQIEAVARIVHARSGQVLAADRGFLIENRLGPVARREGLASVGELAERLRAGRDERLAWATTEALCAPETWFFRDRAPFDQFRDELVPAFMRLRRGGSLRVWSAGCSSGQEPYSLAMLIEEAGDRFPDLGLEVVATDLSPRLLEKAQSGLYTQFEVQRGLPVRRLVRWFSKEEDNWRVSPRIRQRVRFRPQNLLDDCRALGRFDVVFCRNVLSGMDPATRAQVLGRIAGQLADDGALVLGADETVLGAGGAFKPVQGRPGLYVKVQPKRAAA